VAEPSLALQKAVRDRLVTDPAVAALVAGRVYDTVPAAPTFPYVTIGEDQVLDDGNSCGDAWQATVTVHVWTREPPGFPPAKTIAGAVRDALTAPLTVAGFFVISGLHRDTLSLRDSDGLTSHMVQTFEYLIDPAE